MDDLIKMLITAFCSIMASSGFWMYMQKRSDKRNESTLKECTQSEMLRGLGHDRILRLGYTYIERGYITINEYENLNDYLYKPYKKLGGNGYADRVMEEINKLSIRE